MNEMKLPEMQLQCWQPRRPSARLKRRLFSDATQKLEIGRAIRWLSPAAACAVLALAGINQQEAVTRVSSYSCPMTAMIFSNQSPVTYVFGDRQSDRNALSPENFEWTNRSNFASSNSTVSAARVD